MADYLIIRPFCFMISLDLMKLSEVRKGGDRSKCIKLGILLPKKYTIPSVLLENFIKQTPLISEECIIIRRKKESY